MTSLRADEQAFEMVERARVAELWRCEELRHHRRWCIALAVIGAVLLTLGVILLGAFGGQR